jgi:L-ascorbate metabolism protein UlaG (beta-lactamase superfamily)
VRVLRRLLILLVAVGVLAVGLAVAVLRDRPSLAPWEGATLAPSAPGGSGVRVTFAGVSTLAITDGETTLITDGFFTRPGLLRTVGAMIAPDAGAIAAGLARLGVTTAAAVIVLHSHYDHAMDAPVVARMTGAILVGSASTANIARGLDLPEGRIRIAEPDDVFQFGAFTVRMLRSRHFPHGMAMGEVEEPLVPPARAMDYKEGGSYSVVVEHPSGTLLVQGSAGFLPGVLDAVHADVVLLGIAGLGSHDPAYRRDYWQAVVGAVQPTLVVPIHWDDFTRPLDEPLRPMPRVLDDFDDTMHFLSLRTDGPHAPALRLLPPWQPVRLLPQPVAGDVVARSR